MDEIRFKHTNKKWITRGLILLFSAVFLIASGYILLNIGWFWEDNAFEVVIILIMFISFVGSRLFRSGGKELRADAVLSDTDLSFGQNIRLPLKELVLQHFSDGSGEEYFHIYNPVRSFSLYTNSRDDLIEELLGCDVEVREYQLEKYDFSGGTTVTIRGHEGYFLSLNVDTGAYFAGETEETVQEYIPDSYVHVPYYRRRN